MFIASRHSAGLNWLAIPPILSAGSATAPLRMSTTPPTSRDVLDRLDARHDELIERLDELNAQIEAALAEFARTRELPALEGAAELSMRKAA